MSNVQMWNVAAWGWTCQGETRHELTTVATWTRDESVLVLVFLGETQVQAAVLDGESLSLDELHDRVADGDHAEDMHVLFDRARRHAAQSAEGDRVFAELAAVFEDARKLTQPLPTTGLAHLDGPRIPMRLRSSLWNLALAALSTPKG